jgi:hypothetical protein
MSEPTFSERVKTEVESLHDKRALLETETDPESYEAREKVEAMIWFWERVQKLETKFVALANTKFDAENRLEIARSTHFEAVGEDDEAVAESLKEMAIELKRVAEVIDEAVRMWRESLKTEDV